MENGFEARARIIKWLQLNLVAILQRPKPAHLSDDEFLESECKRLYDMATNSLEENGDWIVTIYITAVGLFFFGYPSKLLVALNMRFNVHPAVARRWIADKYFEEILTIPSTKDASYDFIEWFEEHHENLIWDEDLLIYKFG